MTRYTYSILLVDRFLHVRVDHLELPRGADRRPVGRGARARGDNPKRDGGGAGTLRLSLELE